MGYFSQEILFRLLFFGVLSFMILFLIVDFFVCINRIRVHWYWYLSLGVIINCLWAVSKFSIQIWFPTGFWKVLVRVPVGCNLLLTSIDCFDWSKITFKFFTLVYFVDCQLLFITFTGSNFIDLETFPQV